MDTRRQGSTTVPRGSDARVADNPAATVLTSVTPEPGIGSILKGKYRLDSKLGEGGMGIVYKAVDLDVVRSTSYVAIKLLKPELRTTFARSALAEEVELTRKLQSGNIVDVFIFEQDENFAFMVMEFLAGRSLDRYIAEEHALGTSFKLAWPIIKGMGDGLIEAHRHNIVHSDFKPSNVLVTPGVTKVLDFGIARAVGRPLIGLTAAYASRDMILDMPCDQRDDVYSFGLVVYELLSGKHPFCDDDGTRLCATDAYQRRMSIAPIRGLTRGQRAALKGALQFERSKRTASIQDVVDALERPALPVILLIAVCTLLVVIIGMTAMGAYRRFGPKDSYEGFVNYYLRDCGAPNARDSDLETVKQLVDLGNEYLQEGLQPLNPGLLSQNVRPLSSALSVFQEVQKKDCANVSAMKGVFAIVDAYKTEAYRLLAQKQYKQSLGMTEIALNIWPSSVDLKILEADIRRKLGSSDSGR